MPKVVCSADFGLEDVERSGQTKKFEHAELGAILAEDPCQTQEELADALVVYHSTVSSKRLKAMAMISKHV